jgi:sugar phosphate isomerase/epimerase
VKRRTFLEASAAAAAVALGAGRSQAAAAPKFTMCLNVGQAGVKADPFEAVDLAKRYGYGSVAPMPWRLAKYSQAEMDRLLAAMKEAGLEWGAAVTRPFFTPDDAEFAKRLADAKGLAAVLQKAGVTRCMTWTGPSSDTLTYRRNFDLHVRRTKEVGKVLGDHGVRLGIEYLGTKTLVLKKKYPFVQTLAGMKELADATGLPNLGLTLDAWHWFQAGDTEDDIAGLENRDVVTADLCDAPAGIPRHEMPDSPRRLPCATGVIGLKGFLTGLVRIGYDGPVGMEPFDKSLREMSTEQAMQTATAAMKKAFALIQ